MYDLEWNLPPHTLSISQTQFNENIPVGSTIANFSATDPDQDDLTYSLFSFSPLNLNPVLWLDADDPNTITTSSDKISGWNDKSGGNHIFSQSNHQRRPVLRQNKINGKPAVRFDGSDDFLSLNSRMGLSANPALTISAVLINQANTISDQRVFQLGGNAQNIIALAAGTNGWTWRFNGGNKNFGNTTNQQPQVVSWVRVSGANFQQSSFFVNGLEIDALEVQEVEVPRTLQVWLPSDPDQPPTQAFPTSLLMDFLGSSLFLILPPAMTVNPLKTIYLISGD